MNDDKLDAVVTLCPTCEVEMEYTSGNTRCLCHECGLIWNFRLKESGTFYPTKDNPVQEISIYYGGPEEVFPHDKLGGKLDDLDS